MISTENLEFARVSGQGKGKVKYLIDGKEYFAEEAVMTHFKSLGYKAILSENLYWWELMALCFWGVIFAKVRGAVIIQEQGQQIPLDTFDERYERLFNQLVSMNGIPLDFFTSEFYQRRRNLINNRIQELEHSNLSEIITQSFKDCHGQKMRLVESWDKYQLEDLLIPIKRIDGKKIIRILERLIENFTENRTGLPDLIVYNDTEFFFAEAKSENDKISEKQKEWHSFLSESLELQVNICLINHSKVVTEKIESNASGNGVEAVISVGESSSKYRDEAISFLKSQGSYFTQGEGRSQIHGARFEVKDIEKTFKNL